MGRPRLITATADVFIRMGRGAQRAVARIIEAVFEADFLDCSYGFRPGRNPHHALQALRLQIVSRKVNHVFEADIRSYFTRISHQWLRKMVAHRIADPAILKLIGKWLKAGAMVDGALISTEEGTPQGGPISPVLNNSPVSISPRRCYRAQTGKNLAADAHRIGRELPVSQFPRALTFLPNICELTRV